MKTLQRNFVSCVTKVILTMRFIFLFCRPDCEDLREVLFTKMSSIYGSFFVLEEYENLELHLRKETFVVANRLVNNLHFL